MWTGLSDFRRKYHEFIYVYISWIYTVWTLRFRQTKKLRYKQMEIFHQCFQYTPSNLYDFIECSFLLQFMLPFSQIKCLKMTILIDMGTVLCRFFPQKNPQVCIYSLNNPNPNIGHCVELTFLEGRLGRFLMLAFLKWSFKNLLHFESENRFTSRWEYFLAHN